MTADKPRRFDVTTQTIDYVKRGDAALAGDLYLPAGASGVPALVAIHGGGWQRGARASYRHLGHYLAERGIALFAASYRLTAGEKNRYPAAVQDARAAVQFVRREGERFSIDGKRLGIIGDSAGGHLASLVALAGDKEPFAGGAEDAFPKTSCAVKACVGVYGVYDLLAHWNFERRAMPRPSGAEAFIGTSPTKDRRVFQEASPLSHATEHANKTAFLLVWGMADTTVEYTTQSLPMLDALTQSGYFVRTIGVPGAPHYWISEPLDEPGSYPGFVAPRLFRFLSDHL